MLRALALSLLAGAVVPLVWFLSRWLIPSFGHWWLIDAPGWMDSLLLLLWPGSLILLGDVEGHSLLFPVLSIGLNILLYGLIGSIFHLGRLFDLHESGEMASSDRRGQPVDWRWSP